MGGIIVCDWVDSDLAIAGANRRRRCNGEAL